VFSTDGVASVLAIGIIPVCIAIAVVREQLFDIDVVIGRTLVYLGLSLAVALVYLAVVGGAESVLGGSGGTVLPLLGAAVVAQRRLARHAQRFLDENAAPEPAPTPSVD